MTGFNKAVCLFGPTASGKSHLAIELASLIPVEIISVDSALIYRDMNIGTAKPDKLQLAKIPHYLIDIRSPIETYSAAQFCVDAKQHMQKIWHQGKIPLLVGGTMLYFRALQYGLADMPPADLEVRAELMEELAIKGLYAMYQELVQCDPVAAASIKPQDPQRILRALEVFRSTQRPLSSYWQEQSEKKENTEWLNIALWPSDRGFLHDRIAQRFHDMLKQNFIGEVEALQKLYPELNIDMPSMRSVGYRQIWQYLAGDIDKETAIEKAIVASRQLAKRQLTWLRSWESIKILDVQSSSLLQDAYLLFKEFLEK